jgi:hypothetical protein
VTTIRERSTFEERLLPMLVEAIPKDGADARRGTTRRRRSRRSAVLLVAAIVGAAVAGSMLVPAVGERGVVRVYAQDALRDPKAVERTLRTEGGIDAEIIEVPVFDPPAEESPAWWWWLYWDRPVDLSPSEFALLQDWVGLMNGRALEREGFFDKNGETAKLRRFYGLLSDGAIEIPRGIEAHLTLFVGRTVPRGEFSVNRWDRINELAPTGSLYCLGVDPDDPAALGRTLRDHGYQVLWILEDLEANTSHTVSSPPDGTVAVWAWLREPDFMDVRLVDASSPKLDEYRASEGTYTPEQTPPWEPPCV